MSESLAIPPTSILHDEKGDYVWRAKGQKVMRANKGIDYAFPIEKVYISQGDLIRYHTGYNKVVSLKDKGLLEKNDLLLNNPPETLKENQTVIYPRQAYLFMPGDDVKVSITE